MSRRTAAPCRRTRHLTVLCLVAAAVAASRGPANAQTVNGILLDVESGLPIDLGLVMMFTEAGDSVTSTISNEDGFFSVSAPEAGNFILLASALGYRETPAGIFELGPDGVITVEYRIRPEPLALEELVVSLNRPLLEHQLVRNGFVRRYQRGLGAFLTPKDIEDSTAQTTESLFRNIPGVRVGTVTVVRTPTLESTPEIYPRDELGETVQIRGQGGGWCTPSIFVNGLRSQYGPNIGYTLSNLVPLNTVQAVEIYRRPSEVPVEYGVTQPGGDGLGACGVLVIWTRRR